MTRFHIPAFPMAEFVRALETASPTDEFHWLSRSDKILEFHVLSNPCHNLPNRSSRFRRRRDRKCLPAGLKEPRLPPSYPDPTPGPVPQPDDPGWSE